MRCQIDHKLLHARLLTLMLKMMQGWPFSKWTEYHTGCRRNISFDGKHTF